MVDYYMILGVDSGANLSQIKRAFRAFSHQRGAGHAGEEGTPEFVRLKEAYDALSDSARRGQYEQERRAQTSDQPAVMRSGPMDLFGAFQGYEPSLEEIWDWWRKNFDTRHESKSKRVRALNVEVVISAEEAQRGGRILIQAPIGSICDACDGSGTTGYFRCDQCEGRGMLWETRQADVLLSAPVRDGTEAAVALSQLGVNNLALRVHVRVAPDSGSDAMH